jgi:regulator of cell morphogenesis and NO signaling
VKHIANWTVNETLAHYPATMDVFNALGMDTCCGGDLPLLEAASYANVAWPALVRALEGAIGQSLDAAQVNAR